MPRRGDGSIVWLYGELLCDQRQKEVGVRHNGSCYFNWCGFFGFGFNRLACQTAVSRVVSICIVGLFNDNTFQLFFTNDEKQIHSKRNAADVRKRPLIYKENYNESF